MRHISTILLAAVILAASCNKEETSYETQLKDIRKYVEAQLASHPEYSVTEFTGVTRLTTVQGEGEGVNSDGLVKMYYTGSIFSVNIGETFASNEPDNAGWQVSGEDRKEPVVVDLSDKGLLKGLRRGLEGVKPGEVCYILFPSELGMGGKIAGTIPADSALAFKITVIDIEND